MKWFGLASALMVTSFVLFQCKNTPLGTGSLLGPELAAPANCAMGQPTSLEFSWQPLSWASKYDLQISTDSSFSALVASRPGITGTSSSVTGLMPGTAYFWRVNAGDGRKVSDWSYIYKFTTGSPGPVLSSPSNGASGQPTCLSLSWGAVSGALYYELQIASQSAFSTTISDQSGITKTWSDVCDLFPGGTYYWRVNGLGSFGATLWSSVYSFTITTTPAPVLISPANGATNQAVNSLAMSWSAVSGVTSYGLQVSSSPSFASTIVSQTGIAATQSTVSGLLTSTRYYWRVSVNGGSGATAWSAANSFTTAAVNLPAMVNIPAGNFLMGSYDTADFSSSIPAHNVSLSAFSMSKTLITEELYKAVMDTNPSHWQPSGGTGWKNRPVEQITWYDAIWFCNKLSKLAGLDTVYSYTDTIDNITEGLVINYTKNGYRMPTEAEYEYAERAGTTTDFYWGRNYPPVTAADSADVNANCVWFKTDSLMTANVATKKPNAWGLYDMAGNVFSWCNDNYTGSYNGVSGGLDPKGATDGGQRVCRGGSWGYFDCGDVVTYPLASPYRWNMWPYMTGWMVGLRVVRGY